MNFQYRMLVIHAALLAVACAGEAGEGQGTPTPGPAAVPAASNGPQASGPAPIGSAATLTDCQPQLPEAPTRRLSYAEYQASVRALFPSLEIGELSVLRDPTEHGFENRAALLNPSPVLIEQYGTAAEAIGVQVAENLEAVLPCQPASPNDEAECGARFIAEFAPKVLRRPLTAEETADYTAFFEQERAASDFRGAVQLTVEVLLQAPQFLYRLEFGDPATLSGESVQLTPFEVASRISYLFWGTGPDQPLFEAAFADALGSPEQREQQARRLLADPRAAKTLVEFHRQWLDFDRLAAEPKNDDLYPEYDGALQSAIREESDRFIERVLWKGDGRLASFFTSNLGVVNAPLAELYGVTPPASGWAEVQLNPEERAGWLTRANFLASRAHKLQGSPPLRSVFVLERFFCIQPPAPPADADLTEPAANAIEPKTNRELFESRIEPPVCNGCHNVIDTIGYGLENYDAIGAYRTLDNGQPVDARGEIKNTDVDGPFVGGIELSQRLAQSEQVRSCVTKQLFQYAIGREIDEADQCRFQELQANLAQANGDIRELLVALVKSPEFIYRPPVNAAPQLESMP